MTLRWNAILCVSILFIAIVFVGGVLFLAGTPVGSPGQAPTGKPSLVTKTKILSTSTGTLFAAGSSGVSTRQENLGKPLTSKTKILSSSGGASLQDTMEMQPTEPNMTVIAQTSGNLSYSMSKAEVDVTNPPFLIDLTVIPKTVTETKWFQNRSLDRLEETVLVSVVSPSSFANVSVIDKETGKIVAQEKFGRDDSTYQTRAIKVYEAGTYLVQIYGNEVTVQALMSMRTLG